MAYTKIHAIKATIDKAIDYICNPDKTDEQIYVSSYACAPETAAIDFKYTLDHCRENSPNKAYHLIQAFAPGEVSYEEAHRCDKVFHPFLTIFDNLGCCLLCQSRYKIIFSHAVLLPVIDTTKRQPHTLHDYLSFTSRYIPIPLCQS